VGTSAVAAANTIVAKAERNAAIDEATASITATLGTEFEGREREIKAAVRSLTKKLVRQRIVEEACASTGAPRRTSDPSRPRSTCSRPPTARRCSSVARPRSST